MYDHARQFLAKALPPPGPGRYINIHWFHPGKYPGKKFVDGRPCETVDDAISNIAWQANEPQTDLYVCMSTQSSLEEKVSKKGNSYRRAVRAAKNAVELKSLFLDIDVKDDDKHYHSRQEAFAALQAFIQQVGLPHPTAFVGSGSEGFHTHWCLDVSITPEVWQPLADALVNAAQALGLKCDTQVTVDAARILRVPDTFNWKTGTPRATELIYLGAEVTLQVMQTALGPYMGKRVKPAAEPKQLFEGAKPAVAASASNDLAGGMRLTANAEQIMEVCPFVAANLANGGADRDEPQWKKVADISTFLIDGRDWFHAMSMGHKGYDPVLTDEKYNLADAKADGLGWPRCSGIASSGAPECKTCPLLARGGSPFGVTSGVAKAFIKADKLWLPDNYVLSPAEGWVMLKYWDDDKKQDELLTIMDYPILDVVISPDPWILYFTTRVENNIKKQIELPVEVIQGSKDKLLTYLGARGVVVTDSQFKRCKEFLVSWVKKLQTVKEAIVSANPYGWVINGSKIEGFSYGGYIYTPTGDRQAAQTHSAISEQYTPKGELTVWKDAAKLIYEQQRPGLDAILAVAFASPLIHFTGHGGLLLNAYSSHSGIGKSTTMEISQAVWGHPKTAMGGLTDTDNATIEKTGQITPLPMYWDEIKGEEQYDKFCRIIFQLSGSKSKSRMSQNATLQKVVTFNTLMVSAANKSLVDNMAKLAGSTTAGLHRMFEYDVPKPVNKFGTSIGVVQRLLGELRYNYGQAGLVYARYLGSNWSKIKTSVVEAHEALLDTLQPESEERNWVATIAVLVEGARIANEVDLTRINTDELRGFLIGVYNANRALVQGSNADLTTDISAVDVLGEFLSTTSRYTLHTNICHKSVGKPPKGSVTQAGDNSKLLDLQVQRGHDDGILRIAVTYLNDWMQQKGYDRTTWVKKMERDFNARYIPSMKLGGGIEQFDTPPRRVFEIDLNQAALAKLIDV